MLNNVLRWFLLMVSVLSSETMLAQSQADTLGIRFRLDSIRIDMDFAGNRQAWDNFEQNFLNHYSNVSLVLSALTSIVVHRLRERLPTTAGWAKTVVSPYGD